MSQTETYSFDENRKKITDVSWGITYIGIADYDKYLSSADTDSLIWKIQKQVVTDWITETLRPVINWLPSLEFKCSWDDRATYDYL